MILSYELSEWLNWSQLQAFMMLIDSNPMDCPKRVVINITCTLAVAPVLSGDLAFRVVRHAVFT